MHCRWSNLPRHRCLEAHTGQVKTEGQTGVFNASIEPGAAFRSASVGLGLRVRGATWFPFRKIARPVVLIKVLRA